MGLLPGGVPGLEDIGLGASELLFAGGLTLTAGVLVGVLPALHGAWVGSLKAQGARSTAGGAETRLQSGLLVAQVTVAVVLVMAASLLGGSLAKLRAVPMGYDVESVLTFTVRLPPGTYPDPGSQRTYLNDLSERIEALPGVRSVGATSRLPLREDQGWGDYGVRTEGGLPAEDGTNAHWIFANRQYLEAMEIPVLEGRPFQESTEGEAPWSRVVLNASLARKLFGDAPAVGQRIQMRFYQGWTDGVVEAVVGDVFLRGPEGPAPAVFLSDLDANPAPWLGIAVRTDGDPLALADIVRTVVLEVDPAVPGYRFATTGSAAGQHLAARRAVAVLGGIFSGFALLVFSVGLAGLVSHGVVRRRRELGIRVALGAQNAELVRTTVFRPLALVGIGLTLGLGAALAFGGIMESLLFGVEPQDPRIVTGAALLVGVVATVAAWLPARRIGHVQPAEALRPD
jgi:predicted permease